MGRRGASSLCFSGSLGSIVEVSRAWAEGLTSWRWETRESGWRSICEGWGDDLGDVLSALLGHQALP